MADITPPAIRTIYTTPRDSTAPDGNITRSAEPANNLRDASSGVCQSCAKVRFLRAFPRASMTLTAHVR
jgi:hypothetical protein